MVAVVPLWRRCGCWCSHLSTVEHVTRSKLICREFRTSLVFQHPGKNPKVNKKSTSSKSVTEHENECKAQRVNQINIQMLSKSLHRQIFGEGYTPVKPSAVTQSRKHLKSQGLWGKKGSMLPDIDVELPPLMGEDIDGHFRNIAEMQCRPYLDLAVELMCSRLPPMPKEWSFKPGWTKYDWETGEATSVDYPEDAALVFDVEVCTAESPRPILATAASQSHWYSWVSRRLTASEDSYANMQRRTVLNDLILFETVEGERASLLTSKGQKRWRHRLIVGHNVSYDRARIKEQYFMKNSTTKFLDTMSLHTCTSGQTTHQKAIWKSQMSKAHPSNSYPWFSVSSPNGLAEVHWLHVSQGGRKKVSKERRDIFMKGTVQDVRGDFQNLMQYCAEDVFYTHEVLQKVLPLFLNRCPHPVTLAGMLEMGSAYLPVDNSWEEFISNAEYYYEDIQNEIKTHLMALADDACSYIHNARYNSSPWLCNLDWNTKTFRGKSMKKKGAMDKLINKIEDYYERNEQLFVEDGVEERLTDEGEEERELELLISSLNDDLPSSPVHMPGYPEWYRTLCMRRNTPNWKRGTVNISAQSKVTPYLLRMKWKGHPLYYHKKMKWGYIVSPDLKHGDVPLFGDDRVDLSTQFHEEGADELTLEEIFEEHCEELKDEETDLDINHQYADTQTQGGSTSSSKASKMATKQNNRDTKKAKSSLNEEDQSSPEKSSLSTESEENSNKEWRPQSVLTDWGLTDDVVTIGNGEKYYFFKIPHKDGLNANCGNPLSKDYLPKMDDGTLTSAAGHMGKRILTLNSMLSFWRSARNRVIKTRLGHWMECGKRVSKHEFQDRDQFVVWHERETDTAQPGSSSSSGSRDNGGESTTTLCSNDDDDDDGATTIASLESQASISPSSSDYGTIIPVVQVAGTATRRAVEATWLTASNPKDTRVGSELKAMVRAPPGYHLVGADVDSQELWIAAVLGDMQFAGIHGCSAIGWMTLQGNKADGTDVHSITARTIGITRDQAKILNYGRFYGAGKPFIKLLLKKFNPSLTAHEVEQKAETLYTATKGIRMYKLNRKGEKLAREMDIPLHEGSCVSPDDWKLMCSGLGYYDAAKLCSDRVWIGGSESHLFNKLESIAMSDVPKTPVLGCCISRALEKQYIGSDYQTSRVNWVVQSSAVDYLHLLLVNTRWLFDTFNIDGRFCISIHDEVRYLVKSEDRYRAALALQFTNLFTRAMFAHQLNMKDLPQSVAFFSAIDIDLVLRKEPTMDCKTPSNPLGLEKGHNIPHGEQLDIYQLLEKTGATLHPQDI